MILRLLLLLTLLASLHASGDENENDNIPSAAFTVFSNLKQIDPSSYKEIQNMPRVWSQSALGVCFGCAAAVIAQKFACDTDKKIKALNLPCNQLPPEKEISMLAMVAWAETNKPNQVANDSTNHKNITLYSDRTKGNLVTNALISSMNTFSFMPESCYPMRLLLEKYGKNNNSFEPAYFKLKESYNGIKKMFVGNASCPECLANFHREVNLALNKKFSIEAVNAALSKDTFPTFLYSLLFHGCDEITFREKPRVKAGPEFDTTLRKDAVLNIIKEIIDQSRPVLVEDLCTQTTKDKKKCIVTHTLVVSGYRVVCPAANYASSFCRPQVKIHNCWGQAWQDANNDGWVDGKFFVDHINYGKDYISEGKLSWLE